LSSRSIFLSYIFLFKPWEQKDVGQKDETTSASGKHGESLTLRI